MTLKEIEEDALHLSAHERAELAQKLLMSLDAPKMEEMAEDWLVVASRRADEKSGLTRVETIKKIAAYHQYHAVNKAVVFRARLSTHEKILINRYP